MKPYGKAGQEINCCPTHDSTSKLRAGRSNKKRARQEAKREVKEAAIGERNGDTLQNLEHDEPR